LPAKPEGAEWAEPFKVIRRVNYRADGKGFLKEGHYHLFVLPADGGPPRQVSKGVFDHRGTLAWAPDDKSLFISANRRPDRDHDPLNTEIYEVSLADGTAKALTDRAGPDTHPVLSPQPPAGKKGAREAAPPQVMQGAGRVQGNLTRKPVPSGSSW